MFNFFFEFGAIFLPRIYIVVLYDYFMDYDWEVSDYYQWRKKNCFELCQTCNCLNNKNTEAIHNGWNHNWCNIDYIRKIVISKVIQNQSYSQMKTFQLLDTHNANKPSSTLDLRINCFMILYAYYPAFTFKQITIKVEYEKCSITLFFLLTCHWSNKIIFE